MSYRDRKLFCEHMKILHYPENISHTTLLQPNIQLLLKYIHFIITLVDDEYNHQTKQRFNALISNNTSTLPTSLNDIIILLTESCDIIYKNTQILLNVYYLLLANSISIKELLLITTYLYNLVMRPFEDDDDHLKLTSNTVDTITTHGVTNTDNTEDNNLITDNPIEFQGNMNSLLVRLSEYDHISRILRTSSKSISKSIKTESHQKSTRVEARELWETLIEILDVAQLTIEKEVTKAKRRNYQPISSNDNLSTQQHNHNVDDDDEDDKEDINEDDIDQMFNMSHLRHQTKSSQEMIHSLNIQTTQQYTQKDAIFSLGTVSQGQYQLKTIDIIRNTKGYQQFLSAIHKFSTRTSHITTHATLKLMELLQKLQEKSDEYQQKLAIIEEEYQKKSVQLATLKTGLDNLRDKFALLDVTKVMTADKSHINIKRKDDEQIGIIDYNVNVKTDGKIVSKPTTRAFKDNDNSDKAMDDNDYDESNNRYENYTLDQLYGEYAITLQQLQSIQASKTVEYTKKTEQSLSASNAVFYQSRFLDENQQYKTIYHFLENIPTNITGTGTSAGAGAGTIDRHQPGYIGGNQAETEDIIASRRVVQDETAVLSLTNLQPIKKTKIPLKKTQEKNVKNIKSDKTPSRTGPSYHYDATIHLDSLFDD